MSEESSPPRSIYGSFSAPDNSVQSIAFNQLGDMFVTVVADHVTVYCCDPFNVIHEIKPADFMREAPKDGFWSLFRAEMCDDLTIIAIIPASCTSYPRAADNRVWFWHADINRLACQFVSDRAILAVKLREDLIITSTDTEIFIGTYPKSETIATIPTINPMGVLALSPTSASLNILAAFPYSENENGALHVVELSITDLCVKNERKLRAHDNPLAFIVFNASGTLIATASSQGTLISLRRTDTMEEVACFRRGMDKARIYCIAFNSDSTLMSAVSDSGTLHLYKLEAENKEEVKSAVEPAAPLPDPPNNTPIVRPTRTTSLSEILADNIASVASNVSHRSPRPSSRSTDNAIRAVSQFDLNCRAFSQCAHYKKSVFVLTVDCDLHNLIYDRDTLVLKRIIHDKFTDPFNDTGL